MSAELPYIQRRVTELVEEHGLETPVQVRALDLTSEVGELAKEILKGAKYGLRQFEPHKEWEDELGDVLFALVCLANTTGVDLEAALDGSLHKYRGQLVNGSGAGSGR